MELVLKICAEYEDHARHNTSRGNLRRVRYRGHVTYHPLNFPHRVCKAMLSAASMPKYPYVLIVSRVRLHWGDLPLPTTLQIIGLESGMGEAAKPCTLGSASRLRHARGADITARPLHDPSTHKDLSLWGSIPAGKEHSCSAQR